MSEPTPASSQLSGKVALVAGATRGAGRAIAVELARAGAYVYATGRSSRQTGPSEIERPETIDETGEMMRDAGGAGVAIRVDHLETDEVAALVARIESEQHRYRRVTAGLLALCGRGAGRGQTGHRGRVSLGR